MVEYLAGSVGIDIYPNTKGFGEELRRKLARYADDDFDVRVTPDVDMSRWRAAKRRIEDDGIVQNVEIRGDDSDLKRVLRDIDKRKVSPKVELGDALRDLRTMRKQVQSSDKAVSAMNKRIANGGDAWRSATAKSKSYQDAVKRNTRLTTAYANKQIDVLDNVKKHIRSMQDAIEKVKPLGSSNNVSMARANRLVEQLDNAMQQLKRDSKAKIRVDVNDVSEVVNVLENVSKRLRQVDGMDAHAKVYLDGAKSMERELEALRRKFRSLPNDIETDYKSAIDKLNLAAFHAGKDKNYHYEVNLDLDVTRAREKAKKLQEDYKKLEMDIDLKTAGARTHLAMLTRPRSVEIYAKLHATDFGKMLDGMTYGATGLRAVNNQFQKFVNFMDSLDEKVPFFSALGTVFAGISAGAINMSRSVLGVGSSIVSMSKAALAAPAALVGLGAAYASVKMIWGEKGATWSEQIDIASTKLGKLSDSVVNAFYGQAGPAIRGLADSIAATLIPQMSTLADHEGRIVAGMAKMVGEADKASIVSSIFNDVNKSLTYLEPGVESLVRAFLNLGDSTSQYLPRATRYVSELADQFARWVDNARASGEIEKSMQRVIEQAGYLKDSVKALMGIASGLYSALAEDQNGIQSFSRELQKADRAVNSAKFQDTLKSWAVGAKVAQSSMRDAFSEIGDAGYALRKTVGNVFGDAGRTISSFTKNVSRLLKNSSSGISDFSSGVSDGFQKVFDAVGDVSPMFSQLLSTVGQLSRTFGGTLAASLRASAPLIQTIAAAAEAVAKAFSALPEPIQAALGVFATFGKAGKTALDTVKLAVVENTMKSLQWQKALMELGVTSAGTGVTLKNVAQGWVASNPAVSKFVSNVGSAEGAMGKVKAVASGLGGMLASTVSNPVTWGVAAITAAIAAYSDYNAKAQATERASENIAAALGKIPDSAAEASGALSNVASAIQDAFKDGNYAETGWSWLDDWTTGFKNTAEAADKLGVSTTDLSKAASGSTKAYNSMMNQLKATYDAHSTYSATATQNYGNEAGAAKKLIAVMEKARQQYIDNAEATSVANGHAAGYAKSLIEMGEDSDSVSIAIATQSQRQQMLNSAAQKYNDIVNNQRTAQQNALSVATEYGQIYNGLGDSIQRIKELGVQNVWDSAADSFNNMTEAGQLAQTSLQNLATTGHDWLEQLVASGASTDEVNAKQQELSTQFYETAKAMGVPESEIQKLQQLYGLTPEEVKTLFKTETEQSKQNLTSYLSDLRALFPGEGNTAIFTTVLDGINSGALSSADEVQSTVNNLMNNASTDGSGKYTIVLDADGNQAVVATDEVRKHADLFKKGTDGNGYTTNLEASDLASMTIDYVKGDANAYGSLRPTASLGARDNTQPAKRSAESTANQWNGSTYNAQFGGNISGSFWGMLGTLWSEGRSWASRTFNAIFGTKRGRATGGEVEGDNVTRTGRIVGRGTNTSDSIALNDSTDVSTGEYVVRAAAVHSMEALYGKGVMSAINASGDIPSQYLKNARRMTRVSMPSMVSDYSAGSSDDVKFESGPTYNITQNFQYPTITPISVQTNQKLDKAAMIGM